MFKSSAYSAVIIDAAPINGRFNDAMNLAPIQRRTTDNASDQDQQVDAQGSLDSLDVMLPTEELTINQINQHLDALLASHEIYQAADLLSKHAHKFIDTEPEQQMEFAKLGDDLAKTLQSTGVGFEYAKQVQFAIDAIKPPSADNDTTIELAEQLKRRAEIGMGAPSFAA